MSENLVIGGMLGRALRSWKLLLLITILGGLGGWLFHQFQPPLYESQAYIPFDFDVVRTGRLTESEEDIAMGIAGTIMTVSPVPEQVADAAKQKGYAFSLADIPGLMTYERRSFRWVIRIIHPDPETAAFLARTWIEKAYVQIQEAARHAERAEMLRLYLNGLTRCLERSPAADPAAPECPIRSLADLQNELKQTGAAYQEERIAARGMLPYLLYAQPQGGEVPISPARYGRSSLVLAGLALGLLAGFLITVAGWPTSLHKSKNDVAAPVDPRS